MQTETSRPKIVEVLEEEQRDHEAEAEEDKEETEQISIDYDPRTEFELNMMNFLIQKWVNVNSLVFPLQLFPKESNIIISRGKTTNAETQIPLFPDIKSLGLLNPSNQSVVIEIPIHDSTDKDMIPVLNVIAKKYLETAFETFENLDFVWNWKNLEQIQQDVLRVEIYAFRSSKKQVLTKVNVLIDTLSGGISSPTCMLVSADSVKLNKEPIELCQAVADDIEISFNDNELLPFYEIKKKNGEKAEIQEFKNFVYQQLSLEANFFIECGAALFSNDLQELWQHLNKKIEEYHISLESTKIEISKVGTNENISLMFRIFGPLDSRRLILDELTNSFASSLVNFASEDYPDGGKAERMFVRMHNNEIVQIFSKSFNDGNRMAAVPLLTGSVKLVFWNPGKKIEKKQDIDAIFCQFAERIVQFVKDGIRLTSNPNNAQSPSTSEIQMKNSIFPTIPIKNEQKTSNPMQNEQDCSIPQKQEGYSNPIMKNEPIENEQDCSIQQKDSKKKSLEPNDIKKKQITDFPLPLASSSSIFVMPKQKPQISPTLIQKPKNKFEILPENNEIYQKIQSLFFQTMNPKYFRIIDITEVNNNKNLQKFELEKQKILKKPKKIEENLLFFALDDVDPFKIAEEGFSSSSSSSQIQTSQKTFWGNDMHIFYGSSELAHLNSFTFRNEARICKGFIVANVLIENTVSANSSNYELELKDNQKQEDFDAIRVEVDGSFIIVKMKPETAYPAFIVKYEEI